MVSFKNNLAFVSLLLALFLGSYRPQQQPSQPEDPGKAAVKAYKAKNYPAYLENVLKVREKYPHNLNVLSQVARAYALNGRIPQSLSVLRLIADMGGRVDLEKPDFARLKGAPGLAPVVRAFEANAKPRNLSRIAFSIPEKDLIPEGIAYDERERVFYVGSIYRNKIVRVTPQGHVEAFTGSGQDGLANVLGLRVDPSRRLLWVCASIGKGSGNGERDSAVFKYDLRSRRLVERYDSRGLPGKHLFNDIVPSSAGDVFLTDSEAGSVLQISPQTNRLNVLIAPGSFIYPNGIAISPDDRYLFIADGRGIHRFELNRRRVDSIKHPDTISLAGVDGLYWWNGSLVGVQNVFNPERIIAIGLSAALDAVTDVRVLESNHALFDVPTTGTTVGSSFYFIANSQLTHVDQQGKLVAREKLKNPVVLVVPLQP